MSEIFRWGILGCGNIAKKFAAGLQAAEHAELVAVGSRTQENADRFADLFHVPTRHASYEALVADPSVDAIYVSTPHPFHKENTILCLKAGKAVLCEKPFAVNHKDAREMVAVARSEKVFLMEAMWTRFLPITLQVRKWLAEGRIGEARMLYADFGFRTGINPEGRLFSPKLAGGGLLDVGIYPVSYASMVFGAQPSKISSQAHIGETGIDEQAAMLFGYENGALALLSCGIRIKTPHDAKIMGTDGMISVSPSFWNGTRAALTAGGKEEVAELPHKGNGYEFEAEEVARCVRAGKIESDIIPHSETMALMETMDAIRAQCGIKYPME
jgi:dihydrodiol dehydrogenase / D-xylose 1-dehydrogenase (NADP)